LKTDATHMIENGKAKADALEAKVMAATK